MPHNFAIVLSRFQKGGEMMWRKLLIVGLVLGISTIFLSASAWAGIKAEEMVDEPLPPKDSLAGEESFTPTPCVQADLEGKWEGRAAISDEARRNHLGWCDFEVEVDASGAIVEGKYEGLDKDKFEITGGELILSDDCTITGRITSDDGDLYVVRNGGIRGDRMEVIIGEAE
jgi:hypothetical protein